LAGIPLAEEGLKETTDLFNYLEAMGVPRENFSFEISLARGLDYYTGPIFETVLPKHPHIGSLTGGGRYDELIGLFSGVETPAVGTSLGLDRIFATMQQLNMLGDAKSRTQALILHFPDTVMYCLDIAKKMRAVGINVEVFPNSTKIKKQFSYANKKHIPYVIVIGGREVESGLMAVKNLATGEQETITLETFIEQIKG